MNSPLRFLAARGRPALALALPLLFIPGSRAQLHWEDPSVAIATPSGEKLVRTEYRFTNVGPQSVAVTAVEPSCGCVATSLAKTTYAPGEAGIMNVTFDLSMDGLSGVQERTITVKTDDHAPPTVLHLRVTAITLAEAAPDQLDWRRGESPVAKIAFVTARGGTAISLSQAFRASRDFDVAITPESGNRRFRVAITPKSTAAPSFAQIHLRAAAEAAAPEEVVLYANVN